MKRRDLGLLAVFGGISAFGCGTSSSSELAPPASGAPPVRRLGSRPAARRNFRVPYGDAPSQLAELSLPDTPGPHPVVVVIHGGFWQRGYGLDLMEPVCGALVAAGMATWNIEYRRVGEAGGGYPGTLLDAGAAVDLLKAIGPEHDLDLARVVTVGHSAGGHLALWVAGRHRLARGDALAVPSPLHVARAVSLAGVVDLRRAAEDGVGGTAVESLLGGAPSSVGARYRSASPAELLPLGIHQVLVHGEDDTVVPPALSKDYARAAKARGDDAIYVELEDAGHFDVIDPTSAAWPPIEAAIVAS